MSPIRDLSLTYEALNEENTFCRGDTISGTVNFNLRRNTKVQSVFVKAKGHAHVHWKKGQDSFTADLRYFKVKDYLVGKDGRGTLLPKGTHAFKFSVKIPDWDLPPSYKASTGKIVYTVEAKITGSWWWPSTVQTEIKFLSNSYPCIGPVMCPQSGSIDKELGTFSKSKVQLFATVNRRVCSPGDTLSITAKISNSSSKNMKLKFCLQQKTVFSVKDFTEVKDKTLLKFIGDKIMPKSEMTTSCDIKIPGDAIYTLHNCDIISVEYYLKVYADISFAFDPVVVFPIVVAPANWIAAQLLEDMVLFLAAARFREDPLLTQDPATDPDMASTSGSHTLSP